METTIDNERAHVIQTEISPLLDKAKRLIVKSPEQRIEAVSFVKRLKEFKEKIEERFHPTQNKINSYKTYEGNLATEKAFYGPIDEAVSIANGSIKSFDREEALRVQKEAAIQEAKRREAERVEREKLEAKAKKAEEAGKTERAEALREQAENVTAAPSFTPPPPAVKKLIWKVRVTNPILACKSISEGRVPFSVVEFRLSGLNDFAKGYDGKTKIDGFEFYQDVASRI